MQELAATWVGQTVDVVIEQVEPENNKIIGSIRTAIRYRYARDMAVRPTASTQSACTVCKAVQSYPVALQVPTASASEGHPSAAGGSACCTAVRTA